MHGYGLKKRKNWVKDGLFLLFFIEMIPVDLLNLKIMKEKQNEFYSSISRYYREIFPFNPVQLKFVESNAGGLTGKRILDIGCATGELAYQLAQAGAHVTGIDLNADLLEQAKSEKKHLSLKFQEGDMLKLDQDFTENQFDTVLCFGNTLVHLQDNASVLKMLRGVNNIITPGGNFLMQILNYDYILDEKISELPLIETENIKFIRKYEFENNSNHVKFQTDLHLKKENKVIRNETTLLGLRSSQLLDLLHQAGFESIQLYASFNMEEFGGKHLPLVVSAVS